MLGTRRLPSFKLEPGRKQWITRCVCRGQFSTDWFGFFEATGQDILLSLLKISFVIESNTYPSLSMSFSVYMLNVAQRQFSAIVPSKETPTDVGYVPNNT